MCGRRTAWLVLAGVLGTQPTSAAWGEGWREGLSETSVGRFGWWPGDPLFPEYYEEDLVARIRPDRLERTVGGTVWTLPFGARSTTGPSAGVSMVAVDSLNWVCKRFTVDRGASRYSVAVNCLSPGVYIETAENRITVGTNSDLGTFVYMDRQGPSLVRLSGPGRTGYERNRDGDWSENWLLAWYSIQAMPPRQVPVLLVFSHQPEEVLRESGELTARFADVPGESVRAILCYPYGVDTLSPAAVWGWDPSPPDSVIARCRLISGMVTRWPDAVRETYWIDEVSGRVRIRDTFRYRELDDAWNTPAVAYAPLPPLVSFARGEGYDVSIVGSEPVATGFMTKYGELEVAWGDSAVTFELPLPPLTGVHFVAEGTESEWIARTEACLAATINDLVWDLNLAEGGGVGSGDHAWGL